MGGTEDDAELCTMGKGDLLTLRDVLPELLSVVEAAQKAEHEYELCRQGADDGEFALWSEERLYTALHALHTPLAALEEALS